MQKEIYSFKQWCEDNSHSDLAELWDYDKNDYDSNCVSYASNKKVWFKCPRGLHESVLKSPYSIIQSKRKIICSRCNSFGQYIIDTYGADGIAILKDDSDLSDWFKISRGTCKDKVTIRCSNPSHPGYTTTPGKFTAGRRCPLCSGRTLTEGFNDVATTNPELVKYFKFACDSTKFTRSSGKKAWFKCPDCGTEKYMAPDRAFYEGRYHCRSCGDGVSYGNKFVRSLLSQIQSRMDICFCVEKSFSWSENLENGRTKRVYDFYIESPHEIIIEVHGIQHYNLLKNRGLFREYEIEKGNDLFKRELAITNGFEEDRYVVIDCHISNMEIIKKSILDSTLPKFFDFTENEIDWEACDKFASTSSYVKMAADLWREGMTDFGKIASFLGVSKSSVLTYLKTADRLGWIFYETNRNRPLICLDNNYVFATVGVCSELCGTLFGIDIGRNSISSCARGDTKSTKGLHFKYIGVEEYRSIKSIGLYQVFE